MRLLKLVLPALATIAAATAAVSATPQFARMYRLDCSYCHVAPPKLNQRGENFLARGYRFESIRPVASHRTVPLAVWSTVDAEYRQMGDFAKVYPSRVELISGGPVPGTRAFYFAEIRALSQQIGSDGRILNRSGRFEDLFVAVPVNPSGSLTVVAGQFRALGQIDVSRRLGLSEPLVFAGGLPDPEPASRARLTSLRAFSPSGRQPGVKIAYQRASGPNAADGWYAGLTLPLVGELTLPFTDAASFEFEARLKGVFAETYYRRGMTSIGGHVFAGDRRSLATFVVHSDVHDRWALTGAAGFDRASGMTGGRFSVGAEYVFSTTAQVGIRADHRTNQRRDPALLLYVNAHAPFGPAWFRQAIRLQFEQTLQADRYASGLAVSHIF